MPKISDLTLQKRDVDLTTLRKSHTYYQRIHSYARNIRFNPLQTTRLILKMIHSCRILNKKRNIYHLEIKMYDNGVLFTFSKKFNNFFWYPNSNHLKQYSNTYIFYLKKICEIKMKFQELCLYQTLVMFNIAQYQSN